MNLLLKTNFNKMFKYRNFYYICIFFVLFAVLKCVITYIDNDLEFRNLAFATVPFEMLLFLIPIMTALFSGLFISPEFTQGTIRNKLSIGHTRTNIYLADMITVITATLIFFALYEITVFITASFMFDLSDYSFGIISKLLCASIPIFIGNTLVNVCICFIVRDLKAAVLAFLLQYVFVFGAILPGKVANYLNRFSPQGLTYTINIIEVPNKLWLNIICTLTLGVVMTAIGLINFRKCDLK